VHTVIGNDGILLAESYDRSVIRFFEEFERYIEALEQQGKIGIPYYREFCSIIIWHSSPNFSCTSTSIHETEQSVKTIFLISGKEQLTKQFQLPCFNHNTLIDYTTDIIV